MRIRTLSDRMQPRQPATMADWEKEKRAIADTLWFASSAALLRNAAPLTPKVFGTVRYDGFAVDKFIVQILPGFYATGNIFRPLDETRKYPAVLNPHGHWTHGRIETKALGRVPQRCINQALRGMVAILYDMVGYNDSTQLPHWPAVQDPEFEKWNYGRFTLQTLTSLKMVDFACTLPYVDAERIGCTGCSGGGTQTYVLAAIDPRVKVAAPINMASTRMQGGCVCENQAFLRTEYCNVDFAAAFAPNPLFMSASDGDWTIQSETVEFPAVEHIYGLYGKKDAYRHFYQSAPHCYNLPTRERVYRFLCDSFGLPDPYNGEVDFEIDTDTLLIGDIAPYVSGEGFIKSEEQMFDLVKKLLTRAVQALPAEEKQNYVRRVYLLDKHFEPDIPYVLSDCETPVRIALGDCPKEETGVDVQYRHCYNYALDAKRVSALAELMRTYPDAVVTASGKTAALASLAANLTGFAGLAAENADDSDVFIPGSALAAFALK